ncbi:Heat shock factor (HSF)-type [Macleaya cordata]|uniref:Heat shock factor (HSF)-type n=1 Tax=Macleaya cordata TaxID=56857 RepID=A0A200Q5D0_MACCD|nr:Heat shock factor (HSF)-type [Macleaya cordata]
MEGGGQGSGSGSGSGGGGSGSGGGGGGPAPFLLKTYDMVDDSSTDDIVSWSSNKNSFVVWNSPEFARLLLPTYFKHNNFSSFIRQLNTYGFRKIDPERWEFANEDFIKDQKHLLKNIHRRKPIHSHTQPHGSLGDTERAALEEEIERLTQEKAALQTKLWKFKQQQSGTKLQLEDLGKRVQEMEQRQLRMMTFLAKASENPTFVDHLIRMAGSHLDLSAMYKKRRLPKADNVQEVAEITFVDNNSSDSKPDSGHTFNQDFSNRLRLELSPAVSDCNMVSISTQSSSDDGGSPQKKTSEGDPKDANMRTEGLSFEPEILEPLGMGVSFALRNDGPLSRPVRVNDLTSTEEEDSHLCCHLNLTLASSSLQLNNSSYSARFLQLGQEFDTSTELRSSGSAKEAELRVVAPDRNSVDDDPTVSSSQEAPVNIHGSAAPQGRVNDVFWEQFLTERPGSSDTEEASSSFRANPYDEQEERKAGDGRPWRNNKDMEQLTL